MATENTTLPSDADVLGIPSPLNPDDTHTDSADEFDENANKRILTQLNPESALPVHLQNKSFDRDVWERVKRHPLRNPILFRNKLDEDVESREILRQVMAAANEREKEVLLHNQTRVFRAVLDRIIDQVSGFFSQPIAFRSWAAQSEVVEAPSGLPNKSDPNGSSTKRKRSWLARLAIGFLTPKYILLALVIFFGCATGYKQLQLTNLKETVETYKTAAAATDSLRAQMRDLVSATEKDRDRWDADRTKLDGELANMRTAQLDAVKNDAALKEIIKSRDAQLATANGDLQVFRSKQTEEVKDKQTQLDAAIARATKAEASLAEKEAVAASMSTRITDLETRDSNSQQVLEKKEAEIDGLRKNYSDTFYAKVALESDRTMLRFAESTIYNMEKEIGKYGAPDESRLQQFLKEFDAAKQTVTSMSKR